MKTRSLMTWVCLLCLILSPLGLTASPQPNLGKIEWLRDQWGIPHIYSETDAGSLYGLGYATAEERGFQMTYGLRIIQGRLAEVLGDRTKGNRNESSVDNDRKMRTFGWAPAAQRTAAHLDAETLALLRAYCDGVNDSFAAQTAAGTLHPLFKKLGIRPEPWTPADCLLSWWHLAQYFATDGTRDLMAGRNRGRPQPGRPEAPQPSPLWQDDAASVVQPDQVAADWLQAVRDFEKAQGFVAPSRAAGEAGPKFSHAWVVGGTKTTTGSAVLVSDPQTPVRNPSLWMEFHVSGKTFNVRGIGVPGSPGLLIGFNARVAWGITALGADQADLFRLRTDSEHPDQYQWNGQWRPLTVRRERIAVKEGVEVDLTVRETHLGPVVSAFAFRQADDPEVALKRVPLCETNRDTIQGVFAMMRATNATQLARGLGDWRFPSAHCVYGDADGHIGYSVAGAIPIRSARALDREGNAAALGESDADDWRGFVPAALVPQVVDPKPGLLLSANHRPVASFYGIPLGLSTGSMGDTIRSWRLRERLGSVARFSPADVLEVHYDTTNPARREIVRLGLHLRETKQGELSEATLKALSVLEPWLKQGASSDLKRPGAELATSISTFFRFIATPVALKYGGGESGLARFLKDSAARISADPQALFSDDERRFIDTVLSGAWEQTGGRGGEAGRGRPAAPATRAARLGWFESLDGFGSLDSALDLAAPPITCLDGQTIHSQAGQSYTQWVPLHDADSALSLCPIGHSDRPDSPYRTSTMKLWGEAKLHPAPLSRAAVEKLGVERRSLTP